MGLLIHLFLLAGLFFTMGYLITPAAPPRERLRKARVFLHAVGIGLVLVLVGLIALALSVTAFAGMSAIGWPETGVFLGTVLIVAASGIVTFVAVRPIVQALQITHERLQIVEYFIQWMLIYVAVYQVAFEELGDLGGFVGDADFQREIEGMLRNIVDPNVLVVLLLPVLLSVWIAVAMLKLRIEAQSTSELDEAVLASRRRRPEGAEITPDADPEGPAEA